MDNTLSFGLKYCRYGCYGKTIIAQGAKDCYWSTDPRLGRFLTDCVMSSSPGDPVGVDADGDEHGPAGARLHPDHAAVCRAGRRHPADPHPAHQPTGPNDQGAHDDR